MRISIFLVMFTGLQTFALSNFAQNQKLELKLTKVTITEALDKIEDKTDYFFFYNNKNVQLDRIISVDLKDKTINEVLDVLFEGANVSYTINNRQIILTGIETTNSVQQAKTVTGKVTDSSGAPLPGVTVVVKGTTQGIITDFDGKYSLNNVPGDATLVFSFVGMRSQEISVDGKTAINVKMEEETVGIEEVVAVGYGTVKRSDLTGSVSTVKVGQASERAVTSIEQMLQGQVSGVQITQNTGEPGSGMSFSIRGASSISGLNQPLIVIDGYPIESNNGITKTSAGISNTFLDLPGNNALANLNPNDIESVEILKDASATAIYGSRASSGVVLIRTKRGKAGVTRFEYNFRFDISQLPKKIDVLNTKDYINYLNEAYLNSGQDSVIKATEAVEYMKTNTNWQNLIYRTAFTKDHQLNIAGGNEKMKYSVALGYLDQEGIVKNSKFERGSIRTNLDHEINKNLKIGVNMSAVMSTNASVMQSTGRIEASGSVITGALLGRPLQSAYNEEDDLDLSYIGNPLTLINKADDKNRVTTVLSSMFIEYVIMNGLTFKANGGGNLISSQRDLYQPRGTFIGNLSGGYAYRGHTNSFNYLTEYTLNLNRTINETHRINAVVGYTWQEWINRTLGFSVIGFPNDNLLYYDLGSATTFNKPITRTARSGLSSFISRFNYSFNNRYLITFTGRADGSTRLAEGYKWDFFPSLGIGWNLHNEKFIKKHDFISELKVRASYGLSGNQTIAVGATKALFSSTSTVVNETIQTGYLLGNMANSNLHWEITKQGNVGLDLSLFDNRLGVRFDYYNKRTEDLLYGLTIPASNGFTSYNTNQGSIENKGFEFELRGRLVIGKVKWEALGNLSINKNKVIDLGGIDYFVGPNYVGQPLHIIKVGQPIGMFYGYRISGIYQNQAEVVAGPKDASSMNAPGTFKFVDISGPSGLPDGKISEYDREIIGNPYPDFIFGFSNNISWNNLSLSFLVQGSIGQDVLNLNRFYLDALCAGFASNSNVGKEAYDNRWTGEGTSNKYPKPTVSAAPFGARLTDFLVEDASFVRLKNVTLSYNLPIKGNSTIKNLKFFMSSENLFTWTRYKGYDPEINSKADIATLRGIDIGSIPLYRTFSTGVHIKF